MRLTNECSTPPFPLRKKAPSDVLQRTLSPMADGRLRSWLAQRFDDYVEDTVVGHRAWLIVLLFGLGLPVLMVLLDTIFQALYRPGNIAIGLLVGTLVGLALVLVARERARYRAAAIDHTGDIAALRRKPWGEFEVLVGQVIRSQGYVVKERGGFKRDHGVDLIAERGKDKVLVQCKHWLAWKVDEGQVKVLYADVKTQEFTEGWLVTCGRFTEFAKSWAKDRSIKLIDGQELVQLISSGANLDHHSAGADPQTPTASEAPACPNCASQLHRLTNSFDQSRFWSCLCAGCRWTFDDPPEKPAKPTCGRGHQMVLRKTVKGVEYWACTNTKCSRKRLSAT